MAHPVILVPGFWLGAWAWEGVLAELTRAGCEAQALTLPGLEAADTERSGITFEDHVDAICAAVEATGRPTVLAVHSGAGFSGYAASDRLTDRLAAMVYVDTAPGVGAMDPGFDGAEMPLDWESLAAEENLDGLSEEQLQTFRARAVPQPGGVLRGAADLVNDARRDIPSTFVCTSFTAEAYRDYAAEGTMPWLAGIPELTDTTWIDLPTSHWPMWSRPRELAAVIAEVAGAEASALT
ncbi:alpha/beta hydrolase [Georgenia satyanarayanai]|uniref:alpha/beta fold hydrolase n=1 Tax=Georgenia satyanarayanai TaxID=860221 RepID=UPI00203F831F|nr:alpha/beta fold hydrolase [Georgenia satyanarayanai]MCM3660995.1 alpha/beta hydrolase [Georgenia satyanarayanai]